MNNKALLTIITVVLVGILAIMVVEVTNEPDTFGEQVGEAFEEIGDEIDDNTTAQ